MAAPVLPMLGALATFPAMGAVSVDELLILSAETAVGYAPTAPGGERELSLSNEIRPGVLVLTRTPRTTLELLAEPRLYHRVPNDAELVRPLILMSGAVRHQYALSERLNWGTDIDAQYGEVEYSGAARVFGSPLAQPDTEPVIIAFDLNGRTGFRWAATRLYSLSMAAVAGHSDSWEFDDDDDSPTTTIVGGDMTHAFELDPLSQLSFPATGRYYFVSTAPDWTVFTLSAAYRHTPSTRTTLEATGGASLSKPVDGAARVYPRLLLSGQRVVHESAAARVINRLALVLDTTFDPFLGEIYPIVGAELSATTEFAARWSVTVQANGYTAATKEPVSDGAWDTYFGASASAGYELSNAWQLEFGTRASTRAPHFSVGPFELHDNEFWGFVRIRGVIGARREGEAPR